MNRIYKKCPNGARMFSTKRQVKVFKTSDDMHRFLNKQPNNDWQEVPNTPLYEGITKAGTYAYLGGSYQNLKNVDISVLAHL